MEKTFYFSLIIPTYNSAKTISETLRSICDQSYKSIEVLVIDNCSSDDTLQIVKDFKVKNSTIQFEIYSEKDKGIYDAMNKGIDKARGEWIYFLGSDDSFFHSNALDIIHSEINSHNPPVDVIYGNVFSELFGGIYAGEFNHQMLMQKNICHQAIFFRKTIFKKIGGFNLKYPINADWEHNLKWFFNRKIRKHYIDLVICKYGTEGISSTIIDYIFKEDKEKLMLKYGWKKMSLRHILQFIKVIFRKYI